MTQCRESIQGTLGTQTVAIVITQWKKGNESHQATSWNNPDGPPWKATSGEHTAHAWFPSFLGPPPLTSEPRFFSSTAAGEDAGLGSQLAAV